MTTIQSVPSRPRCTRAWIRLSPFRTLAARDSARQHMRPSSECVLAQRRSALSASAELTG